MTPRLKLIEIRRVERVAVAVLSVGDERFEVRYLCYDDRTVVSPRSPMNFTREEIPLQALVERFCGGGSIPFPVDIVAPNVPPERANRRWSFFDTEQGRALLRAQSAA